MLTKKNEHILLCIILKLDKEASRKKSSKEKHHFYAPISHYHSLYLFINIILCDAGGLRFCHRSDGRYGFKKIFQDVLCPTQLFQ